VACPAAEQVGRLPASRHLEWGNLVFRNVVTHSAAFMFAINDLLLVDYTGRLFRDGKAATSSEVADVLKRLGTTAETWQMRPNKLSKGHLFGRFFVASRL